MIATYEIDSFLTQTKGVPSVPYSSFLWVSWQSLNQKNISHISSSYELFTPWAPRNFVPQTPMHTSTFRPQPPHSAQIHLPVRQEPATFLNGSRQNLHSEPKREHQGLLHKGASEQLQGYHTNGKGNAWIERLLYHR